MRGPGRERRPWRRCWRGGWRGARCAWGRWARGDAGMGNPGITGAHRGVRRNGGSGAGPRHARHYFHFRAKSAAGMRAGPHATARGLGARVGIHPHPACAPVGTAAPCTPEGADPCQPRGQSPVRPVSSALCHPRGHSPLSRLGLVDSSLYPCQHSPPPARSASALLTPHECYYRLHLTVRPVLVPPVTANHDPHVHPTIAPGSLYELPPRAPPGPMYESHYFPHAYPTITPTRIPRPYPSVPSMCIPPHTLCHPHVHPTITPVCSPSSPLHTCSPHPPPPRCPCPCPRGHRL